MSKYGQDLSYLNKIKPTPVVKSKNHVQNKYDGMPCLNGHLVWGHYGSVFAGNHVLPSFKMK